MIIKRIQLENIRSYIGLDLKFPIDSILLWGDIGSGKSTILMSIAFALFGFHNNISGNTLLRHGKNNGKVRLTFQIEDKEIIIERTLKRSKTSINQDKGKIRVNSTESEKSPREIKANVLNLIGYPDDLLNKKELSIFQYTVYTPQEEIKKILYDSADNRLQVLKNVFEIEKYKRIQNNISNFITQINSKNRYLKGLTSDLSDKKIQLDELDKDIIQKTKELRIKTSELNILTNQKKTKKAELKEVMDKFNEFSDIKEDLAKKSAFASSSKKSMDKLNKSIDNTRSKIDELNNKIGKFVNLKPPTELNLNQLTKKKKSLESEISKERKNEGRISTRIEQLERILEDKICEVCEQEVQDVEKFEHRILDYKKSLNKLIEELNKNEEEKKETDSIITKLTDYTSALERNKIFINQLDEKKEEFENLNGDIDNEIEVFDKLTKEIAELDEVLDKYKGIEDEKNVKEQELEQIEDNLNQVSKAKSALEADIKTFDRYKTNLKEEIESKEKAQEFSIKILQIKEWLQHLSEVLQSIEKEVMVNIWNQFNTAFQNWFNLLIEDESIQVKIDDSFAPEIIQNGYITDYEQNLSGGEKTSVALAYRLALNRIINLENEQIKTKDLLILDEPTDGFSSQQLQNIRDILHKLNTKQTIIVSHEPEIESFVAHTIKIDKKNHVSSVIK